MRPASNSPPGEPPGLCGEGGGAIQSRRPHFFQRSRRQTAVSFRKAKQAAKPGFAIVPHIVPQATSLHGVTDRGFNRGHVSAPRQLVVQP